MGNPDNALFRHIGGEEPLNDFFASLLSRTDVDQVMNEIHDGLEFQHGATVVGTQRDGLPNHPEENSKRRTLDWVIQDGEKIVGYESKTNDKLKRNQLLEERRKLEANADGREVHLFGVTEDLRQPDLSVDFSWLSWHDIADSLSEADTTTPITELMSDMLENEGYGRFEGFTPYSRDESWLITHQNEAVDFALEAAKYAEGVRFYHRQRVDLHNRVKNDVEAVKNNDYQSLGPSYFVFPNHPVGYRESDTAYNIRGDHGWYIAITIPALHNEVYVQLDTYLSKNEDFPEMFSENAEEITELVMSNDMTVWTSPNSLNREDPQQEFKDRETIRDIFRSKGGEGKYKRIRMGWEVDVDQPSDDIVAEAAEKMERLQELFYHGVEMRQEY